MYIFITYESLSCTLKFSFFRKLTMYGIFLWIKPKVKFVIYFEVYISPVKIKYIVIWLKITSDYIGLCIFFSGKFHWNSIEKCELLFNPRDWYITTYLNKGYYHLKLNLTAPAWGEILSEQKLVNCLKKTIIFEFELNLTLTQCGPIQAVKSFRIKF